MEVHHGTSKKRRMDDELRSCWSPSSSDFTRGTNPPGKTSVQEYKNGARKAMSEKSKTALKVTKRRVSNPTGDQGASVSHRRSSQEGGVAAAAASEAYRVTKKVKKVVQKARVVDKKKQGKGSVEESLSKAVSKKQPKKPLVVENKKKTTRAVMSLSKGRPKNVGLKGKGVKAFGFWRGSRLRRMASLNAQAKVHIFYEKEPRNGVGGADEAAEHKALESSANVKTKKDKTSAGKVLEKVVSGKQKRRPVDDPSIYAVAPKRMASLNAQAILAASYSTDRSTKTKDKTAKMMASIEAVVAASIDDAVKPLLQKGDTVMEVINAVASEGLYDDDSDSTDDPEYVAGDVLEESKKKGKRTVVVVKPAKTRTKKTIKTVKKTRVSSDEFAVVNPKKSVKRSSKTCSETLAVEGLLAMRDAVDGIRMESDRDKTVVECEKEDLEPNAKTVSPPGFIGEEESLPNKVEVKAEAIRRDKIEDTAEVTITGMYVNPVTNTSQSFCISRIHTYKQATSTRSYSPPPSAGNVGPPPSSQMQQSHHVGSGNASGTSSGGMMHGGHVSSGVHHHGGGLYPYSAGQACSMGGVPLMDVALSRHYGSAFTVPHYGHHTTLPYPHGYYQPAGPMIQSLADPCLIHKPVAFHPHPFAGDRCQSHSQPGPPPQPHQPFPTDSCHTHQTTPYPPTGPGPGGQQQVYAGGGVSTASPSSSVAVSTSGSSSSSATGSSSASNGPTSTAGGTFAALDKCKSSGGNLACPPPPSTSEHYFTDGCQSCAAVAAAAAAVVAGCQSDQYPSSVQLYSRTTGGPGAPPPPPPPTSSVTQFLHAREHLQATVVNGGSADPYGRLPSAKPDVCLQNAALPTQTKTVKVEANDLLADANMEADGFVATSNPSIAAAAKTPKNGRQPHLHNNKSSPPSADVVSVANEQSTMHPHLRPKEARLTVSLEDVFRNTSTDQWIATSLQHRLQALHVNVEQDSDRRRKTNGLLTRSKASEIARNKHAIQTRSCHNVLSQRRAKLGIRDVTNERRSLLMTTATYEERRRSSRRFQSSLIPYPMSGRRSQSTRLSCSRGPFSQPLVPVQSHSSRSTATSKGPSTRRPSLSTCHKASNIGDVTPRQLMRSKSVKKFPRYSNGWTWEGTPFRKAVYLHNDDPPVVRRCYPSMRHVQGDIIRVRDCILLKSGPRKMDLPFVAKVAALWENPDDGEMMVSLLWYYRPEHTDQGRKPHHMEDEIFASKHRDVNSVACIEDKCHVLTFNEYCRYHSRIRILDEGLRPSQSVVSDLEDGYPRKERQPSGRLSSDLVFFCRKVYDFRQKRILKNPS